MSIVRRYVVHVVRRLFLCIRTLLDDIPWTVSDCKSSKMKKKKKFKCSVNEGKKVYRYQKDEGKGEIAGYEYFFFPFL